MTKQEFFSTSRPYGLKFINKGLYEDVTMLLHGVVFDKLYSQYGEFSIGDTKPIIRPTHSKTKECVQSDYNNGKPFVPIVELAKIAFPKYACFLSDSSGEYVSVDTDYDYFRFGFDGYNFHYNGGYIPNQLQLFQLLIKWHFWPNKPVNEEVIYVTDEFNPYK